MFIILCFFLGIIIDTEIGTHPNYEQKNTMLRNTRVSPTDPEHNSNKSSNLKVKNPGLRRRKGSTASGTGFTVNTNQMVMCYTI